LPYTAEGRCVSLLKILFTNHCIYDCTYCVNRSGNDIPRATLEPGEIVRLTIDFYRRNYIEGLFLRSFQHLRQLGVVTGRALPFIRCDDMPMAHWGVASGGYHRMPGQPSQSRTEPYGAAQMEPRRIFTIDGTFDGLL